MPKQVSLQLTDQQDQQVEALSNWGFGNRTDILRIALDRMFKEENEKMNPTSEFEQVRVMVGASGSNSSGFPWDNIKYVTFRGVKLAEDSDRYDQNRPTYWTLYRTDDGRHVVYIEDRSNWQGETSHFKLHPVKLADLRKGGDYEALGREAGIETEDYTLDEFLAQAEV